MVRTFCLFSFGLFAFCYAFQPELVIYNGPASEGDYLSLKSKEPDLVSVAPGIINAHKSFCYTGFWVVTSGVNYTGSAYRNVGSGTPICRNYTLAYKGSARYLGPADQTLTSISFYPASTNRETELIITETEFSDIPFLPHSLFTTAWSNWTLFSGANFDGIANCYISNSEFHGVTLNGSIIIRSVKRGCGNTPVDKTIYAQDFETQL